MRISVISLALAIGVLTIALGSRPAPGANAAENGRIAFASFVEATQGFDIFTMNPDGTDVQRLTELPNNPFYNFPTSWSPDGSRLLFTSNRTGSGDDQVWMMNADGSNPHQLTDFGGSDADWSPDGERIAFVSHRDGAADIYVMNADGTDVRNVTSITGGEGQIAIQPNWSPDGSRILYARGTMITPTEICVMNDDGTGQTKLTHNAYWEGVGDWSPDGSRIVFSRQGDSEPLSLYLMDQDGSRVERLAGEVAAGSADWSPDGGAIVFEDGGPLFSNAGIHIVNPDGSGYHRVSPVERTDVSPVWQPAAPGIEPLPRLDPLPENDEGCEPLVPATPTPGVPVPTSAPSTGGGSLPIALPATGAGSATEGGAGPWTSVVAAMVTAGSAAMAVYWVRRFGR